MRNVTKRNSSGQILIAAVLIIALILLSTELYVYELGTTIDEVNLNSFSDSIFAIRLGSQHVIVGSLANVSRGGTNQILATNLERWSSFVWRQIPRGKWLLNFTTRDTPPYSSGIWINWSKTDGLGVSGAFANFSLDFSGIQADAQMEYDVNITTTLNVEGVYRKLTDIEKQVNMTCSIFNEGEPALANSFVVWYNNGSNWVQSQQYNQTDYGNGIYRLTFNANIAASKVQVSVGAYDWREVYVQANTTCSGSIITNGNFTSDASGWNFVPVSGSDIVGGWENTGQSGGSVYIDVTTRNESASGYWNQSFPTSPANPNPVTLTFQWKCSIFDTVNSLEIKVQIIHPNATVFDLWSQMVNSTTEWSGTLNINVDPAIFDQTGTYSIRLSDDTDLGNSDAAETWIYYDDVALVLDYAS